MEKGDKVVSLGDPWIPMGSVGKIVSIASTIQVKWLELVPEQEGDPFFGDTKRLGVKTGMCLFHSYKNITLKDSSPEPNRSFKTKISTKKG